MNLIMETKFGSHLYGLDTPNSDLDIKGIFLPTLQELLLGNYPKSIKHSTGQQHQKNTKDDIDTEYYSLPYFIKFCKEGNTTALDMLHATSSSTIKTSKVWEDLQSKRKLFYTSSMQSLVGYARNQAAKYGLKGTRLASLEKVLNVLSTVYYTDDDRINTVVDLLPIDEFCKVNIVSALPNDQFYEICGKKYPLTMKVYELKTRIEDTIKQYGDRAKLAQENQGVDWKALSHALRAAYQMKSIYEDYDFEYPLKQTYFIKQVKLGLVDFTEVKRVLEEVLERVEELSKLTGLPKKCDDKYWDEWLLSVYTHEYKL